MNNKTFNIGSTQFTEANFLRIWANGQADLDGKDVKIWQDWDSVKQNLYQPLFMYAKTVYVYPNSLTSADPRVVAIKSYLENNALFDANTSRFHLTNPTDIVAQEFASLMCGGGAVAESYRLIWLMVFEPENLFAMLKALTYIACIPCNSRSLSFDGDYNSARKFARQGKLAVISQGGTFQLFYPKEHEAPVLKAQEYVVNRLPTLGKYWKRDYDISLFLPSTFDGESGDASPIAPPQTAPDSKGAPKYLTRQQLEKLLPSYQLSAHLEALLGLGPLAIGLVSKSASKLSTGASHFGGQPDLPAGWSWPLGDNAPLSFLLQINCGDLVPYDTEQRLPSQGMLYFFCDIELQPCASEPEYKNAYRVLYSASTDDIVRTAFPKALDPEEGRLRRRGVQFTLLYCLDEYPKEQLLAASLDDMAVEAYYKLYDDLCCETIEAQPPTKHWLLGRPEEIQGGDMRQNCAEAYAVSKEDAKTEPQDWRLLMQFDTDEKLGVMWGDCGHAYFWIRGQDLKQLNFADTYTFIQGY